MNWILILLLGFIPGIIFGEDPLPECQLQGVYKCDVDCACPNRTICDENTQQCMNLCGNGFIEADETCTNCKEDYPCPSLTQCVSHAKGCVSTCGNTACEPFFAERCDNCADCTCPATSSCDTISGKCVTRCGNGLCESSIGENATRCAEDCRSARSVCLPESGDTCDNSAACACPVSQRCQGGRCVSRCGNDQCESDALENYVTCYEDCELQQMAGCRPFNREGSMLVRASRRGEIQNGTFFGEMLPPLWAPSFDTDSNEFNFARWTPVGSAPMNNSASPPVRARVGGSAMRSLRDMPTRLLQVNDPSSQIAPFILLHPGKPIQTTIFHVDRIFGPESVRAETNLRTAWSAYLVAGRYFLTVEEVVPALSASGQWGLAIPQPAFPPPQPCNPTPCDTQQNTIPYPPNKAITELHYGPTPDSHTPYLVLTKEERWVMLMGGVRVDGSAAGISVIVVDRFGRFPPIEKTTTLQGTFQIVVPHGERLRVFINAKYPPEKVPTMAHHYDPEFESRIIPNITIPSDMTEPGRTNVLHLGTIELRRIQLPPKSLRGTGTIGGLLTAKNIPDFPLQGVPLYLRNADGKIVSAVKSDASGRYLFGSVAAGRYFIEPILRKGQLAIPVRHSIELENGKKSTHHDFLLDGVSGSIQVQTSRPGTLVMVTRKEWMSPSPPDFSNDQNDVSSLSSSDERSIAAANPLGGASYYLTCWIPDDQGVFSRYPPLGSLVVNDGQMLKPEAPVKMRCP